MGGIVFIKYLRQRIVRWAVIGITVSLTCPIAANADILNVCSSSECYLSIQDAINAAHDKDTVIVHDDIYYENINFRGKAITVTSKNGPGKTTIKGVKSGTNGSVVTFDKHEDENSVLDGFTITGGSGNLVEVGQGVSYRYGGGIDCNFSSPKITNCIIVKNEADKGGGISCRRSSSPQIINCTIIDNKAKEVIDNKSDTKQGSGIYCYESSPYIVNTIVWWNTFSQIYATSHSTPKLSYCNIQHKDFELIRVLCKGEEENCGLGNIFKEDPQFVEKGDDYYHLQDGSLCINAGHPRIKDKNGTRSDMGAYGGDGGSDPNSKNITVAADGSGDYKYIQDAIDYSVSGDTITVLPGTYNENLVMGGKEVSLLGQDGPESTIIKGTGSGAVINLANVSSGDEGSNIELRGFTIRNGFSAKGGGIFGFSSSMTITACTISENKAKGVYGRGGGIYSYNSPLTITNCTISNNISEYKGGGIYFDFPTDATPKRLTITDCIISSNVASHSGGGIYCNKNPSTSEISDCIISGNTAIEHNGGGIYYDSSISPRITDCTISNNTAWDGGGIYCDNSSPMITDCTVSNNTASSYGGGISSWFSAPQIARCTVSGNKAIYGSGGGIFFKDSPVGPLNIRIINSIISGNVVTEGAGGGVFCYDSSAEAPQDPKIEIINCTISGNMVEFGNGGGILRGGSTSLKVVNTILWGNMAEEGTKEIDPEGKKDLINITYSDIKGGDPDNPGSPYLGNGNIGADPDDDPLFVDPRDASQAPTSEGNYHLQAGSPCIDLGRGNIAMYLQDDIPPDDIDGDNRPQGAGYDMGADEVVWTEFDVFIDLRGDNSISVCFGANQNLKAVPSITLLTENGNEVNQFISDYNNPCSESSSLSVYCVDYNVPDSITEVEIRIDENDPVIPSLPGHAIASFAIDHEHKYSTSFCITSEGGKGSLIHDLCNPNNVSCKVTFKDLVLNGNSDPDCNLVRIVEYDGVPADIGNPIPDTMVTSVVDISLPDGIGIDSGIITVDLSFVLPEDWSQQEFEDNLDVFYYEGGWKSDGISNVVVNWDTKTITFTTTHLTKFAASSKKNSVVVNGSGNTDTSTQSASGGGGCSLISETHNMPISSVLANILVFILPIIIMRFKTQN